MPTPLIIARSFKAAHAFASDELGLRVGHYRVVNTAGTLKAVRGVDVHLVPGWDKAPGHFAIKTALRYAKGLNIIDHAAEASEPKPTEVIITAVPDDTEVPQHHVDMVAKVLPTVETDFFDGVDVPPLPPEEPEPTPTCVDCGLTPCEEDCRAAIPEAVAQVTQDDEPEVDAMSAAAATPPTEKPKAKRRSRCKDCGNLHFKDEPCPEDAS